ncbi:hypothetical protein [Streptomyces sp. NPDC029704]|uniref:hypothetical protein n=1 Tax=Streptomyces sp. NPDC029704 TaxID=3156920 RepID=UPI0033EE5AF8
MMQHVCGRCQGSLTTAPVRHAQISPVQLITEAADQLISTTCSRQLRDPDEFVKAVEYMLSAHPKATDTTLVVARDFASRMPDSQHGHVAYAIRGMMQRLGLGRSTITDHVRVLRELGLLAWVSHGSRRNVLRERLGERFGAGVGYRGTATIYAPCAPPAWDQRKGKVRAGHGYQSRIQGYTAPGRQQAIAEARSRRAQRPPRTPSFTSPPPDVPAPIGGEIKTPGQRSAPAAAGPSRRRRKLRGSTGVSPREAEAAIVYAQQLRLEVWWVQHACVRRLGYAVRPLIEAGYSWQESALELAGWRVLQRPDNVIAYIRAGLRRRAQAGVITLPEYAVQQRRHVPADDDGRRHAAMPEAWLQQYGPAYARYRRHLAGPLRAALKQSATRRPAPEPPRWTYRLREPEEVFWASLPPQDTPLPIGTKTASGRDAAAVECDRQQRIWAALEDHAQAVAAFRRLREELASTSSSAPVVRAAACHGHDETATGGVPSGRPPADHAPLQDAPGVAAPRPPKPAQPTASRHPRPPAPE